MKPFVNPVEMKIPVSRVNNASFVAHDDIDNGAFIMENLVTNEESAYIRGFLNETSWQPVSVTGMQGNYEPGDPIGSWRASSFQEEYAEALFDRLVNFLPDRKICTDKTNTDWDGHGIWEPIGVNPLLRFIKYTDGGYLVPHYDASYVASDEERTLSSLVIYLDKDPEITGGAVQFLHDQQAHLPVRMRNLDDLKVPAKPEEVRISLNPKPSSGLVFDHRVLHESQQVVGNGQKTIIRTDIMYRKVK